MLCINQSLTNLTHMDFCGRIQFPLLFLQQQYQYAFLYIGLNSSSVSHGFDMVSPYFLFILVFINIFLASYKLWVLSGVLTQLGFLLIYIVMPYMPFFFLLRRKRKNINFLYLNSLLISNYIFICQYKKLMYIIDSYQHTFEISIRKKYIL